MVVGVEASMVAVAVAVGGGDVVGMGDVSFVQAVISNRIDSQQKSLDDGFMLPSTLTHPVKNDNV